MNNTYRLDLQNLPVYVINLKEDIAKKKSVESQLKACGFKNIIFFEGTRSPIKKNGVAISHNLLLKSLGEEQIPCIVLEDDVSVWDKKSHIDVPIGADAYYLGNSIYGLYENIGKKQISLEKFNENTYRIYNMLAAHAILYLNKEYVNFIEKAIRFQLYTKDNQDKARAETMKYWNIYAAEKPMFYQNGGHEALTKIILPGKSFSGPECSRRLV
jgi:GR25 family glycosyltransferase involved in LPS biosynthesis